jgi:hypothetical protein
MFSRHWILYHRKQRRIFNLLIRVCMYAELHMSWCKKCLVFSEHFQRYFLFVFNAGFQIILISALNIILSVWDFVTLDSEPQKTASSKNCRLYFEDSIKNNFLPKRLETVAFTFSLATLCLTQNTRQ